VRDNGVKRTLAGGGVALGTMVGEFATLGIARLAARAGAEFVLFDLEHSGYGIERMRTVIAAARSADVVPFLRVPDAAYDLVARGLDVGAMGLMVPAVESVDEANLIVDAARFPPVGRRGFGLVFRDDWEADGVPATLEKANAETLVLVQIETAAGRRRRRRDRGGRRRRRALDRPLRSIRVAGDPRRLRQRPVRGRGRPDPGCRRGGR
jgi:2-keto-3-deoxy-L-rhamnonate aldolase RhmA